MQLPNNVQTPQIDITQTFKVECICGHSVFETSFVIRKASALITGTGQEGIIPITLFTCKKCGEILKDTIPPEIRSLEL